MKAREPYLRNVARELESLSQLGRGLVVERARVPAAECVREREAVDETERQAERERGVRVTERVGDCDESRGSGSLVGAPGRVEGAHARHVRDRLAQPGVDP